MSLGFFRHVEIPPVALYYPISPLQEEKRHLVNWDIGAMG